MLNLLIPDVAAERLREELSPLNDRINYYFMHEGGDITLNGVAVNAVDADIHLGWFSNDVMSSNYGREYAVQLLKSPNLKWVQSASAGLDNPFFAKLAAKGIRMTNSNAQAPAIAEYVLASVLERYQGFVERRHHQANQDWQDNHFRELYDSNWMVIGYGNIGRRVGTRAKAFEANVIGVKRVKGDAPGADSIITYDEVLDALPDQDVVVLACALTDDTRDMVDETFLNAMKRDAVLVNIGRGDLVDENALLRTLDSNGIDYAVLDVFREEPLPAESPFWTQPRVLVTPHSSNRGSGTSSRGDDLFMSNLQRFANDEPLLNEVDLSELI
ncbi:MAG: phosphoglycerate dehydrogenase-like enzyme [Candidatus Azotimanducaceae bacterium]